jgi:signal transduction histidine kinase
MGQTEVKIFVVMVGVIVLIFISGTIIFIFQYRKRRMTHEAEKIKIEKQHKLDLLNTQVKIQQQTMQFIGQEIHDSVAQKLTLASIYTQRMEFETQSPIERDKLSGVSKILNDSLLELRQLSKSLTDNKLQSADLQELIRMECDQVNATGICSASFEFNELPVISISTKSSLLRIIQEFIQNSIKHSGCKEIKIKLNTIDNELTLLLDDNGKGFYINNPEHKGIGLDGIRRRIQMLGGKYNLESHPGRGVHLELTIPINNSKD